MNFQLFIGSPEAEEDKVVYLLASLPKEYNMLVTALEANEKVPDMDLVIERLLNEERKLKCSEVPTSSEVHGLVARKQAAQRCYECGRIGHTKRFCWFRKNKNSESHKAHNSVGGSDPDNTEYGLTLVHGTYLMDVKNDRSKNIWIVDSGATCHMANSKNLFRDIIEIKTTVRIGD